MSRDTRELLQARLDQNYQEYLAQLREKPFEEIVRLAPEITAAQQLCDELAAVCNDVDVESLLALDDPLEALRDDWKREITDYDHGEEMSHMLWNIRNKALCARERQSSKGAGRPLPSIVQGKQSKKKEKNSHER